MAFDLRLLLFFLPPVANISGKNFLGAFFILKVSRVPNFLMLPTPLQLPEKYLLIFVR
jgi:hypothetical protein